MDEHQGITGIKLDLTRQEENKEHSLEKVAKKLKNRATEAIPPISKTDGGNWVRDIKQNRLRNNLIHP